MKWFSKDAVLVLLGVTAAAGLGTAGASLYQALTATRVLVSVGSVGTTALNGIQHEAQERRRTVLRVLAAEVSAGRRARSAEVRSEDTRIAKHFQELMDLDPSSANRAKVAGLRDRWKSCMDLQERVISLVLEGKLAEAQALEAGPSSVAFERFSAGMQAFQKSLADFSAQQQETVRAGMKIALAELGALGTTTILYVATLIWSRRKQRKLIRLQNLNEQLERERGRILDMAGRYEPLLEILKVLVLVTQKQFPGSVAVSVIHDGLLSDVVAPDLPKWLLEVAYPRGAVMRHGDSALRRNEALLCGLSHSWSQEILSSTESQIGCVDVYLYEPGSVSEAQITLLEGVAKLAGIIIQHRGMYEQLAFQATCDPLTGLPNRRVFQDRLEQAILRTHRGEEKLAVLLIDLDRFKQVNDLLGHHVGDALLREVAHRVGSCLRKSDTLSRIGGDEFTVLLNSVESVEGAEKALRRIAEALQAPLTLLDHKISVSASIGLSVYPAHGQDPATLMRNADLAMYHAKGRGRNGWQTYVPELGASMLRRMSIEKALDSALENGELELHYQIQTDIERRLTGVEALIRWQNLQLGQVAPLTFVPVAEESGLIVPIGTWVLEQACCKAASWLQAGFPIGRIAVNVSARQLGESGFVKGVRSALELSGLSPEYLELELTESTLMYSFADCMHRLRDLRELGVTVAIDDFGTGYSSLSYLQKLPVSRVKIDQSFIHGITDASRASLPLIRAIVDLAHGLGLMVIAEGVETECQFEALAAIGCNQVQGFLVHQPQPSRQVETAFGQFLPDLARLGMALRDNIAVPRDVAAAPVSIGGALARRGRNPR